MKTIELHLEFIFERLTPGGRLPGVARVKEAFTATADLVPGLKLHSVEVVRQGNQYDLKAQASARLERCARLWAEHGLIEMEGANGRAQIMGQRVYTVGSAPPLQA